jgi:hypothetical protein
MDLNIQYSKSQCLQTFQKAAEMHHIPYSEAVGLLVYLSVAYLVQEHWRNIYFACHFCTTILGLKPDQSQARPNCGLRVGLEYWQA